ncbi:hypothetical protein RM53_06225 [Brevundimonas nasdae]|uniref:Uncharacterized protein n=1 Tax=Brevundimonas nasdae TaxID=172043 RepID=A0A0B4CC14_9CAUL|nr:hypothetical protein RM53_06225 [Brevundimonas nasdae]
MGARLGRTSRQRSASRPRPHTKRPAPPKLHGPQSQCERRIYAGLSSSSLPRSICNMAEKSRPPCPIPSNRA